MSGQRTCQGCGASHWGKYEVCVACRIRVGQTPTQEHSLPAGRWVKEGLIQVFKPYGRNATANARKRKAPKTKAISAPCGTASAYRKHLRNKEEPCTPCRVAHAEARTVERDRQRARRAGMRQEAMKNMTSFERMAAENVRYGQRKEAA